MFSSKLELRNTIGKGESVSTLRAGFRLGIVALLIGLMFVSVFIATVFLGFRYGFSTEDARTIRPRLRVKRWFLSIIARASGLRIVMQEPFEWPEQPFLLLSNHVSYWDIIAIGSLFPMSFVAKSEIESWPLIGRLISMCQTQFVERDTVQGRVRALHALRRRLAFCPVCIFPEGTTSARLSPVWQQWYRGQISVLRKPGVRVYTLALTYKDQATWAWIDDDALLPHLWRCLKYPSMELTLCVAPLETDCESHPALSTHARAAFEQTVSQCRSLPHSFAGDLAEGHPHGEYINLTQSLTKK